MQSQVKEDITQTLDNLKVVHVPAEVPVPQTVTVTVPKIITVEEYTSLSDVRPLKEVTVYVEVPKPEVITKEVTVPINVEEPVALVTTGRVVQEVIPKTVVIQVPYYEVIDVPVNISSNPPPQTTSPPPIPAPPLMPPGVNYGKLVAGVTRPPKRRKQEEEVVI